MEQTPPDSIATHILQNKFLVILQISQNYACKLRRTNTNKLSKFQVYKLCGS